MIALGKEEKEGNEAPPQALDHLSARLREDTKFSLGKGLIVGILGKIAGTAIVTSIRKSMRGKVQAEVMSSAPVQEALKAAAHPAESKAIIDHAFQTVISEAKGVRGHVLRNGGVWGFLGGVAGGVGALGLEYLSHQKQVEKTMAHLNDVEITKRAWTERVQDSRQGQAGLRR